MQCGELFQETVTNLMKVYNKNFNLTVQYKLFRESGIESL